jgi:fructoselysine 3-epimerase
MNYNLEEAVERTATAGFDAIDIWGGRPHAYRSDLREHDIRQIRALLDDFGLEIASFIPAQFQYPSNLCHPRKSIRVDSIQYMTFCVESAARLGAPIISVCAGHTLNEQSLDEGWDLLANSLMQICDFSSNYDVLIAIEPAEPIETDLINTTLQAMDMIDQLGCDNLGVLFDAGHAFIVGEDTPTAIENLGEKLLHLHLSDNDGKRDQHLIPGKGEYDYAALIRALRLALYDGFLTAELGWDYTLDPDPAAVEAQDFLANLIED